MRPCPLRLFVSIAAFTLLFSSAAQAEETTAQPPQLAPPNLTPEKPGRLTPSLDAGLIAAVCGVGKPAIWRQTRFCLSGIFDSLWGRRSEQHAGWGLFAQAGSAGFRDLRLSAGLSAFMPLSSLLGANLRLGPLLRVEKAVSPGLKTAVEIGHRSFNHKGRYSLTHALVLGFDWSARNAQEPANTSISIGLRVDAYWLTAPAMLFQ